jgi:hypothetical protein
LMFSAFNFGCIYQLLCVFHTPPSHRPQAMNQSTDNFSMRRHKFPASSSIRPHTKSYNTECLDYRVGGVENSVWSLWYALTASTFPDATSPPGDVRHHRKTQLTALLY